MKINTNTIIIYLSSFRKQMNESVELLKTWLSLTYFIKLLYMAHLSAHNGQRGTLMNRVASQHLTMQTKLERRK